MRRPSRNDRFLDSSSCLRGNPPTEGRDTNEKKHAETNHAAISVSKPTSGRPGSASKPTKPLRSKHESGEALKNSLTTNIWAHPMEPTIRHRSANSPACDDEKSARFGSCPASQDGPQPPFFLSFWPVAPTPRKTGPRTATEPRRAEGMLSAPPETWATTPVAILRGETPRGPAATAAS